MFRPKLLRHEVQLKATAGFELWQKANRSACQDVWNFVRGRRLACNGLSSSGWSTRSVFCVQEDTVCGTINTSQVRTFWLARATFNSLFVLRHSCTLACHVPNRPNSNSFVKQETVLNKVKNSLWLIIQGVSNWLERFWSWLYSPVWWTEL